MTACAGIKHSLRFLFLVFSFYAEVFAVDRELYIKFNYSCRVAPRSNTCPNIRLLSAAEAKPDVFDDINTFLTTLKESLKANQSCLNVVGNLFCEARFGKCESGKTKYNTTFVMKYCNTVHLAHSGCSLAVQEYMKPRCIMFNAEAARRKEEMNAKIVCKERNETTKSFCPQLPYKVLVNPDYWKIITEIKNDMEKNIKRKIRSSSCYRKITEIICAANNPICTEDEQFVGYFLTKQMCMEKGKCYKPTRNTPKLNIVEICENLPSYNASKVKMAEQDKHREELARRVGTTSTPSDISIPFLTSSMIPTADVSGDFPATAMPPRINNITRTVAKVNGTTLRVDLPSYSFRTTGNPKTTIGCKIGKTQRKCKIIVHSTTVEIILPTDSRSSYGAENNTTDHRASSDKNEGRPSITVAFTQLLVLVIIIFIFSD